MIMPERAKQAGELLRFVTPMLLGIALFVLSDIRGSINTITATISNINPRVAVLESRVTQIERDIKK